MSVPKGQQEDGKLLINELARDHVVYVLQITSNEKVFLPKYQTALTNEIIHSAMMIHKLTWSANNVLVNSREHYYTRRDYQERAAIECNNLLSMIDIAKPLFKLDARRCTYWGNKVIEIRNKTRNWIESDAKRYAQYR